MGGPKSYADKLKASMGAAKASPPPTPKAKASCPLAPPRDFAAEAAALDKDGGHSYKDHGSHTTDEQHKTRLETGTPPSGPPARAIPGTSSKFASPEKHVAANADARKELGKNYLNTKNKPKKKVEIKNQPLQGAGTSYELVDGKLVSSPANHYTAVFELVNAKPPVYKLITLYPA